MAERNSAFKYKKLINGNLALGYGSKYQLLRMLGWHRENFTNIVKSTISYNGNIKWLDFLYDGYCDAELLNVDFIPSLKDKWRSTWACGKKGLNWDAIGLADDGTYIFVEAKAHLSEYVHRDPDGSTSNNSKQTHIECVRKDLRKYSIDCDEGKWLNKYYQMANRIVITDFMIESGYKAKLLYVFFENGFEFNRPTNDSTSFKEWNSVFDHAMRELGIKGSNLEPFISKCIINCNQKGVQ